MLHPEWHTHTKRRLSYVAAKQKVLKISSSQGQMNTERHSDDKDKHPVECVQMAKNINKKTVLSERQNATHSTGEAIMQRHEE